MKRRRLARMTRQGPLAALLAPAFRLTITRYNVPFEGLSAAVRLVIISDLHYGWGRIDPAFCNRIRRRVHALAPDVVLFLGDLAGGYKWETRHRKVDAAAQLLTGYTAPFGTYAILGNHEWGDDPKAQARRQGPNRAEALLRASGWHVLENDAVEVAGVWMAGIGSQRAYGKHGGSDDLDRAMNGIPGNAPVLLLAHEPDIFPDLPRRVRLTLSGHTHAGQIRPFNRAWHVPSRYGTRYAYGHIQEGGRHLIVSGGLGCSTVPIRYGIPPEITVVELTPP